MSDNTEKKVIVDVQVNTDDVDRAKKELKDIGSVPIPTSNVKSLKAALKEATDQALLLQQAGKENTEEYRQAVRTVAELKDQQDVLNRTVAAFDPGNKFNAFVGIAKGAAGAIQGAAGALSLFGVNSETALESIAKLQALMAFTDGISAIGDLQDHYKGWILQLTKAKTAVEGTSAATKVATTTSKGLGIALKGLGIGLVVSAVAYLVTNWKELSDTVTDALPFLKESGKTFTAIKDIAVGVGKTIIDFIATPVKVVANLIKGDFKAAVSDLREGADVVGNLQRNINEQRIKSADEAEREIHAKRVKQLEDALAVYKAAGIEVTSLEKELHNERIKAQKAGSDEYNKAVQERTAFELSEYKKHQDKIKEEDEKRTAKAKAEADKRKQILEEELKQIKANFDAAKVLIEENGKNDRDKELLRLDRDYQTKVALAKKHNKDVADLNTAYNIEKLAINKKYDDLVAKGIEDAGNNAASLYEKKSKELAAKINELRKNATDEQKRMLDDLQATQQANIDKESQLSTVSVKANINLIETTTATQIDEADTPDIRRAKIFALSQAQVEAEKAAFELKIQQLQGQNEAIEELTAQHNSKLVELERGRVESERQLNEIEKQNKIQALGQIGNAVGAFANIVGENTVLGKAMAVASTTITTFESAMLAYRNGQSLGGPWGIAAGVAAAAAAVATGLSNIKKILAVDIPGKGKGSVSAPSISAPSMATATAPVVAPINQNNQVQDVRIQNLDKLTVRAIVTDKDLRENEQRASFLNGLSTL